MSVYNQERYLRSAIESVLSQTYEDFEFIVWDDGSTDGSVDIIKEYASMDERVRPFLHHHLGTPFPLLNAAKEATGEYLGWIDSDDRLAREALTETVAVLDAFPDVGLVYTNCKKIDPCGRVLGESLSSKCQYSEMGMLVDFLTFHFRLLRKSVYEKVGGIDPTIRYSFDYDLCLRMCEITKIYHLRQFLYYHRIHEKTISRQHKIEQILFTQRAIENAITRRNLQNKIRLDLEIIPKFRLLRKE